GELKGAIDVPGINRQLEGVARQVDGALDLPHGFSAHNDPNAGGRYFVEDKAGKSFNLDQAKAYSERLKNNALKTGDPEVAKGLIYVVEDAEHAKTIARVLADENLDQRIYVATFKETGELTFVARPGAPPPPTVAKGGKVKKP